ncbi:DUF6883 domain-containing protein [Methylobacterium sp. SD21]|uniref:DUF6883 domain-containing protein n=1 Tax=Methylobacterium litchii TaxID=3138810 RepID=UPI00313D9FE1
MSDETGNPTFEIPIAKIVDYLLNVDHPKGGSKARFFLSFGFDPGEPTIFARAIVAVPQAEESRSRALEIGDRRRLVVEGSIEAPDGRRPRIRIVWQGETNGWRLITAYPL